ncbi:MAG: CDP-alcohol phosphatidyltransferase family protein [Alphaproteobacteria bacterium]|nr:CDP-alcohol phosphatidyltransferase family protein [Alphaproteobacteria bacterium]MCW5744182.1 CDP-alcohol phosphatidyltransferase family protein [Alphaproteobacteria bacterium]
MLDPLMRRIVDPALDRAGRRLVAAGASADGLTLLGLVVGLACVPLLAAEAYGWALACCLANRAIDGLDGAVARIRGPTDFGGYADILADMVFYAAVVLGFALARPENALWSALLLAAFVGTASSFLGYAVIAAKRGQQASPGGRKSFYHAAGLIEGTETIAFLVAMMIYPSIFKYLSLILAGLCAVTVVGRLVEARRRWRDR